MPTLTMAAYIAMASNGKLSAPTVAGLAEPGAVLITARVQRQVAGLFVAEERGTHTLKGVSEPTALYRLVRASGGGRRAGQRHRCST